MTNLCNFYDTPHILAQDCLKNERKLLDEFKNYRWCLSIWHVRDMVGLENSWFSPSISKV